MLVATLHDEAFHAALETANKRLFGFQPHHQYLHTIGECDVALLPLADTRFSRTKSDLKFVECAPRGAAVLASAVVYGDSVGDGVDARLAQYRELLADKDGLDAGIRERAGRILESGGSPAPGGRNVR